ncbi:peptidase M41 [Pseudomonas cucumis]|uniref:Peptidase M41 n=1 Tax=Pseudomonas cucumis TaxID=2954082 RepID=A0ABY9EV87_9PSED|nr:peptidase M41 [Pseudomonas cucumis]WLG84399.1 peptidase M41 [Pseudomonas cucumis]
MKSMPAALRDYALQIANHEMGHYVVARALGFETGDVTLKVGMGLTHHGGASITLTRSISSIETMKAYLEARTVVLFAGAMGQTLPSKHSPKKRVDEPKAAAILKGEFGAQQDYAKIRELRYLLRNIDYPDTDPASSDRIIAELTEINDRLWLRTQEIVEVLADTITGLAGLLVERMVIVEQWGRPADTYEVVLTGEVLERLQPVQAIPSLGVWT